MTPKTISLETADREGWSLARSLVEFFSAEPFLGFPIVQRWADAEKEGIDLGPRSPESVHRGKSWARHFVTRRGDVSVEYLSVLKMTNRLRDQSCGSPNLSSRLSGHQIRRLGEGVGERDIQTWHFQAALSSPVASTPVVLRPSKTERRRHLESASAAAARGGRERAEIGFPMSHNPPNRTKEEMI